MLSKSRIGTICFYVTDIDRTERFYRDVIGLDVQRLDDDGSPWLMAAIENNVELIFFKAECRPGNSPIIVFGPTRGRHRRHGRRPGRKGRERSSRRSATHRAAGRRNSPTRTDT